MPIKNGLDLYNFHKEDSQQAHVKMLNIAKN